MKKKLLAYKLESGDEEGHAEVHFFFSRSEAKTHCAGIWGMDYIDARVSRAKEFDSLEGSPTDKDYIARGWWMPCGHCVRKVSEDLTPDEDDEESGEPLDGPAFDGRGKAFCSSKCLELERIDRAMREENKRAALAHVAKTIPCVTDFHTFNGGSGHCQADAKCFDLDRNNIVVEFDFAGAVGRSYGHAVQFCGGCKRFWLHPDDVALFDSFKPQATRLLVKEVLLNGTR